MEQRLEVLVVEDNPGDYRLVAEMLREEAAVAFRVRRAETLAESLTCLRETTPDVVLLDLQLPDSQGLETLRRVCAEVPSLPVIVMTGAVNAELGIMAMQESAQDYLKKDRMDSELLVRSIRYAVERNKLVRELERKKSAVEKEAQERTRELLEAREALENARRLSEIGLLAATVAHELRNPLGAIKLAVYNIEHRAHDSQAERHLRVISRKVGESNQIINNLLFYSRIRLPAYERIQIADLLEECLTLAQQHAASVAEVARNWETVRDLAMAGDPLQLKELFGNLFNNAFEAVARRPAGRVGVAAEIAGSRLRVRIVDNGVGIAAGDLEKVRQPFFSTKAKGTGLGLAVACEIAHLHGGDISIASVEGESTTVTVELPLERKPAAAAAG